MGSSAGSSVEFRVESQVNAAYVKWLFGQLQEEDRVVAPDGECEAIEFGAVNPVPGEGLVVPWARFADDPVGVLAPMLRRGCPQLEPVMLGEYVRKGHRVSFRWGRHVPTTRALPGAVVLG